MKLNRADVGPLGAIVTGAAAGTVALTGLLLAQAEHSAMHVRGVAHEHVDGRVVESPVPTAEAGRTMISTPEGLRVHVRGPAALVEAAPDPLVYVDGVRLFDRRGLDDLDPDRIDRVEIVKGEAAIGLFGGEAAGGVIQVYLKREPRAPSGR